MSGNDKATDIIFVHGAGEGSYEWTIPMIDALQKNLGPYYNIHFLKMPDPVKGDYNEWAKMVNDALSTIHGEIILMGHSFGGSVLLRFLVENTVPNSIVALFLLAVPYWGEGGWDVPDFKMPANFESKLESAQSISMFHAKDDEVVPFAHLKLYHKKIPRASVYEFPKGGHALKNCMNQVGDQIHSLQKFSKP